MKKNIIRNLERVREIFKFILITKTREMLVKVRKIWNLFAEF